MWCKFHAYCLLFRTWSPSASQDSALSVVANLNESRNNCGHVPSDAANMPTIYSFYNSFACFCQKGSESFESLNNHCSGKKCPLVFFATHVHDLICIDKSILWFFCVQNDLSELVCIYGVWYHIKLSVWIESSWFSHIYVSHTHIRPKRYFIFLGLKCCSSTLWSMKIGESLECTIAFAYAWLFCCLQQLPIIDFSCVIYYISSLEYYLTRSLFVMVVLSSSKSHMGTGKTCGKWSGFEFETKRGVCDCKLPIKIILRNPWPGSAWTLRNYYQPHRSICH